ncbi:uncharacterized protein AB675_721 [Cyphellophora attinorum]|uniref:Xylanolytic transcriptional activator regulatory domain-containing protein n=1 Tax=Cyphellophora attinorum TaxID=1664694 RepID=A0A0N1P3G3_9EURO|nr:uncharacterized protein AB675_721 [Phialophora attinorum]KPI45457.1 hypothetical protein AB675_721 [Phialophora attinorum]
MRRPGRPPLVTVSATHLSATKDKVELWFGPSSDFALLQLLYRHLYLSWDDQSVPDVRVEDGNDGLDTFDFRLVFFGNAAAPEPASMDQRPYSDPFLFMPYELAQDMLDRYLASYYNSAPFVTQEAYHNQLRELYQSPFAHSYNDTDTQLLLLAIAIASLSTNHWQWAEVIAERVKRSQHDVHTIYEKEHGRPNAAYLTIGAATRKALAMGLHREKKVTHISAEDLEERRITLWTLCFHETWMSFYGGRPILIANLECEVPSPNNTWVLKLKRLTKVMMDLAATVYATKPPSLPECWKAASSAAKELQTTVRTAYVEMGINPDDAMEVHGLGYKGAFLHIVSSHITMIAFRPFVLVRSSINRTIRKFRVSASPSQSGGIEGTSSEANPSIPAWLDEACERCTQAAQSIISFFHGTLALKSAYKELRYSVFFIGHAAFLLLFDSLQDPNMEAVHLSYVTSALEFLDNMGGGDPANIAANAVRHILGRMQQAADGHQGVVATDRPRTRRSTAEASQTHPASQSVAVEQSAANSDFMPSTEAEGNLSWLNFDDVSWEVDLTQFDPLAMDFSFLETTDGSTDSSQHK